MTTYGCFIEHQSDMATFTLTYFGGDTMDTIEPSRRSLRFQVYEALMSNVRPSYDVEIHSFHNDGKFSNMTFRFSECFQNITDS
jgi:hypothetical protein